MSVTSNISLAGRRALVTGAGSGIGAAVTRRFGDAGAQVIALDVRPADGIRACDVTDETAVEEAFERAGPLSDVVHAAGVETFGPFRELTLAEWRRMIDVNLTGSFLVLRAAARCMPAGGSITLLASVGGLRGDPLWAAYSASKFGVVGLMQSAARELARDKIRVNAVCPGGVRTPMGGRIIARNAELSGRSFEDQLQLQDERVPLGALATPEQIADVCLFLASDLASYVAGASMVVNGGGAGG